MRTFALTAITALLLSGLPPALPVPVAAQRVQNARDGGAIDDPESLCRPYLEAADHRDTGMARGRGRGGVRLASPMPPPPPAQPRATQDMVVTGARMPGPRFAPGPEDRERYSGAAVAAVQAVAEAPVSTFSVDVDTGSYANVRRMLNAGRPVPAAAVRTEEMLNYFRYDYPAPNDRARPFSITTDMTTTPWNPDTRLLRIGLRGYDLPRAGRPPANLVFLVDTSGSMWSRDKLPLVQCALALLANQLGPRDRVAIVAYAGSAGLVLPATNSSEAILNALKHMEAGGSTAGAAGIQLAYRIARENRIEGGVNRVILATDGDFNVGVSDNETLVNMVERERDSGITLTTLGFGTGNYNEAMMERIADHGNGNYAYIDTPREARKVLDDELSATLFTIASDVKIQVEFNPAYVREYRLIGYENRALREEDFANDAVDAGDIGAGHQVTALYEIVPAGAQGWLPDRRYAANQRTEGAGVGNDEAAFLRLRYKLPGEDTSRLIEQPVNASRIRAARAPAGDSAFAAAVAAYGQLLRGDTNMGRFTYADARALAAPAAGRGYWRQEFLRLTDMARRGAGGAAD
jgi:Ca-activated chloride channel family protein